MWARWAEILIGAWLLAAPAAIPNHEGSLALHDYAAGALVIALAAASFTRRFAWAHLGAAAAGLWLAGFGWAAARGGATPVTEHHVATGVLLLMFAIIPNRASKPPAAWRRRWGENDQP